MEKRIEYLNITPADNGLIISYDECYKPSKSEEKTYDMPSYQQRKEVFDFDDASEMSEGFNEAMARFKELCIIWMNQKKKS